MKSCILMSIFIFILNLTLVAQTPVSDLILLKNNKIPVTTAYPVRPFLIGKTSKPVATYNPLSYVAGGAMSIYQNVISPQFSANCLYHPGCSDYSKMLIQDFGLFKGIVCSADRLMRCNRISALSIRRFETDNLTGKITETTNYYRW
jgi:uncharacterized protein